MPYQLFDPTKPCTSLLPLNPVQNKLTFYKVSVFEVSLQDIADIADLPAAYARPGAPQKGSKDRMRLGLPISTLFPELREKYQEVQVTDASDKKIPVIIGLEGSFLPFDPNRPIPKPLPEHSVSAQDVIKGHVQIDGVTINLDKRDQQNLAIDGVVLAKVNGSTARLRLDTSLPSASTRSVAAMTRSITRSERSGYNYEIQPADFITFGPHEWPDDYYDEAMLALLADPRSGISGFTSTDRMSKVVSQIPTHMYANVLRSFKNGQRFVDLMLRFRRGPLGAVHSRPKLPRYDIGLFTSFEQTWSLQGYSRGSLVNSLTLAPEEELTIEIFTFDRRKVEEERTLTSEFERNSEVSSMTNITSNIARELSETNQMSGDIGLGLPLSAGGVPVDLNLTGSASLEVKADIQSSMEQVAEVTSRVSQRIKSTRQVKVLEARETGREDRVTRKIRNPNQGYALTLNCYEVLETYKVDTALKAAKQFCLLVEQPYLGGVDIPFVLAYQDRLQQALLSKTYLAGFDAARSLYAQGWFDNASIQKAEIEEAANQSVAIMSSPKPEKPIVVIGRQLAASLTKLFDVDLIESAGILAEYYNPFDGIDVSEKDKAAAESALGLFNYAFKLKMVSSGIEDRARTYIDALENDGSEAAIVEALGSFLAGADDEWITNLKMLAASLVSANLASLLTIPFPVLVPVFISLAVIENNAGYPGLVGKAKQELKAYETAASVVPPAADQSTAADIKTKEPPPQLFSLQDLAMARADFDALRLHIEANRVYYMNQIWKAEDPNARFERFRQMGIEAFVENRLIGFIGDRGVFPLRLSALDNKTRDVLKNKLTSFDPTAAETVGSGASAISVGPIQVGSQTFSLPTSAVYMDGALGQCELLEPYLVQRRDIERRIAQAEAELAEIRVAAARASMDDSVATTTSIP
jgi:hypothetical protein